MGFNTVAMILNDHMNELEKCPKSLAYALCNPPFHGEKAMEMWRQHFKQMMDESGERNSCVYPLGGINILPTFHADDVHFLYAGKNTLERLDVLRFHYIRQADPKTKKATGEPIPVVTLLLPDWADPRKR